MTKPNAPHDFDQAMQAACPTLTEFQSFFLMQCLLPIVHQVAENVTPDTTEPELNRAVIKAALRCADDRLQPG